MSLTPGRIRRRVRDLGVLYHLRYPLLAPDRLHDYAVKDVLVFQSMLRGSREVGDVRAEAMLRSAGFEVFICRRVELPEEGLP